MYVSVLLSDVRHTCWRMIFGTYEIGQKGVDAFFVKLCEICDNVTERNNKELYKLSLPVYLCTSFTTGRLRNISPRLHMYSFCGKKTHRLRSNRLTQRITYCREQEPNSDSVLSAVRSTRCRRKRLESILSIAHIDYYHTALMDVT